MRHTTAGLRFGFHNHWAEVEPLDGGGNFLDLLRELPAALALARARPRLGLARRRRPRRRARGNAGRCPLVHVKDYASREGRNDVPVGDGIVGYERVMPAALAAGAEWLVVEEDDVGPIRSPPSSDHSTPCRRFTAGA